MRRKCRRSNEKPVEPQLPQLFPESGYNHYVAIVGMAKAIIARNDHVGQKQNCDDVIKESVKSVFETELSRMSKDDRTAAGSFYYMKAAVEQTELIKRLGQMRLMIGSMLQLHGTDSLQRFLKNDGDLIEATVYYYQACRNESDLRHRILNGGNGRVSSPTQKLEGGVQNV